MNNFMAHRHQARLAKLSDAKYVAHLQRKFTNEIGFIPNAATIARIEQRQVHIALENGDPAGFILTAPQLSQAKHIHPIFQAAVQMDAQRRHHGLALLELITTAATTRKQTILQCFCRETLDANAFWRAAGFINVAYRTVNASRGSGCILWRKPLAIMTADTLMQIPTNPRHHAAGGRSVRKFAWDLLPNIDPMTAEQVTADLRRLQLAA